MSIHEEKSGCFALMCTGDGAIEQVLRNDLEGVVEFRQGSDLLSFIPAGQEPRLQSFFKDISEKQSTFNWEVSIKGDDRLVLTHLSGLQISDSLYALVGGVISESADAESLEGMMKTYNSQVNVFRETMKRQLQDEVQFRRKEESLLNSLADISRKFNQQRSDLEDRQRKLQRESEIRSQVEQQLSSQESEFLSRSRALDSIFSITELTAGRTQSSDEILQRIAALLPESFTYSSDAHARINVNDKSFTSKNFETSATFLKSPVYSWGKTVGSLELFYSGQKPDLHEGPFHVDERRLLDFTASRISSLLEGRQLLADLEEAKEELLVKNEIASIFLSHEGESLFDKLLQIFCDELNLRKGLLCVVSAGRSETYYLKYPEDGERVKRQHLQKVELSQETISHIRDKCLPDEGANLLVEECSFDGLFTGRHVAAMPLCEAEGIYSFTAFNSDKRPLNEREFRYLKNLVDHISPVLLMKIQRDMEEKERVHAQEALRQSEERYRSISRSAFDSFYLLKCKRDNNGDIVDFAIVDANEAAVKELDMPREKLIGRGINELFSVNEDQGFFSIYKKVFEERVPYEGEYHIPSEYAAPGWYFHQVTPTLDGVAITNRDITARKHAEQALIESEEKFREVVEGTSDLIIQFDFQGRITYANHASLDFLGYRPENLIGRRIYDYLYDEDAEIVKKQLLLKRDKGDRSHSETIRFIHKDGTIHHVLLMLNLHFTNKKTVDVITAIGQDISNMKRYEEELRNSEERFKAIVSSANETIFMVDLSGKIRFANQAAVHMLEADSVESLIGTYEHEFYPDDLFEEFTEIHEQLQTGKTVRDKDMVMITRSGRHLPVEVSSSAIRDIQGEVIYRMSIIRNVSERRQAQEALKESERKYRTLVENIEEGVGIVDLEERILFVNQSAAAMFGSSSEAMQGCHLNEYVDEESLKLLQMETELRKRGVSSRYEVEIRRKDSGEPRTLLLTASPRLDQHGNVAGTFGIFHDITEKKAAEEELQAHREHLEEIVSQRTEALKNMNVELIREVEQRTKAQVELDDSRSKYRMVVENSSNAIAVVADGELVFVNPRFLDLLELKQNQLQDYSISSAFVEGSKTAFAERLKRTLAGEQLESPGPALLAATYKGSTRWLESTMVLIEWEEKPAVLVFLNDITRQKQVQLKAEKQKEQLLQADKMASLGTLVAGVAHEINNPNNYILLSAQTLTEAWKGILPVLEEYHETNGDFSMGGVPYSRMKDKIIDLSEGLFDSSLRIKELVSSLKDYARQDTSNLDQSVDVNEVVKSAITLLEVQLEKATDSFESHLEKDLPAVRGNANRLVQVVVNLLQNALEALQERTDSLSVSTSYDASSNVVQITVEDSGLGISQDHINSVRDPFFTTKRDIGGTGLGLSVSSGIIEDHGGTMTIESQPDEGTTVTVALPAGGELQL